MKLRRKDYYTNDYIITSIDKYSTNDSTTFGISIKFERNTKGRIGILVNYNLMSAMLVLAASINFLIDPNMVPGRAGMLVTLFLVTTGFFSDAQVGVKTLTEFSLTTFLTAHHQINLLDKHQLNSDNVVFHSN